MKARILIADDEKDMCWAIARALEIEGYEAHYVLSGEAALERVSKEHFDLAIVDYRMTGIDGLETLRRIREASPNTNLIFITAYGDQELALHSLELGADEYINKPFNIKNLLFRVFKTLRLNVLETEVTRLKGEERKSFSKIIFAGAEMKRILDLIDRVARHPSAVLITGETGTGKELVAAAIHHNTMNPRKDKPFLSVNCGAIPEPLIESELFGHVRGAFTGAMNAKTGLFEAAGGGTIFLDELSSASPALQVKLLRVLDSGEFYQVGDTVMRKTDTRVITATNKELADEVARGNFREDLFHRLRVVTIDILPLRRRKEDIPALIDYFLNIFNTQLDRSAVFTEQALETLTAYDWPGNVRELKHCVESLLLMSPSDRIRPEDLPERIKGATAAVEAVGNFAELKNHTKSRLRFYK